jgi:Reverse transcriptase (RNA-dependent DNA polymerase)
MLHQFPVLFGGGLGTLKIRPIHLELRADAKPYHSRPFPVLQSLYSTTKTEIKRLIKIGVLKLDHESEWAAPTFVQPKKTGDVRILTDFRKLNEAIVLCHKPFPLPKISDLLQKLQGFTYATAIDLSMGYYHIPLDNDSQKLCTLILPWGKYKYLRLLMGIKNSPDILQAIMHDILGDLEYSNTYIDDILITSSGNFKDHLERIVEVLK